MFIWKNVLTDLDMYLGDGWTEVEKYGGDTAFYMEEIVYPPVPHTKTAAALLGQIVYLTHWENVILSLFKFDRKDVSLM